MKTERCQNPACSGNLVYEIRARFGKIPYFSLKDVDLEGKTIEEAWEMIQTCSIEHNGSAVLEGRETLGPNPSFVSLPRGQMYEIHLLSDSPEFAAFKRKEGLVENVRDGWRPAPAEVPQERTTN